jgi:hypothetical protein
MDPVKLKVNCLKVATPVTLKFPSKVITQTEEPNSVARTDMDMAEWACAVASGNSPFLSFVFFTVYLNVNALSDSFLVLGFRFVLSLVLLLLIELNHNTFK